MQTYGPTIRYHCPLDCGWHYDPPPASPENNPNQYAQQHDETFQDMITRMAGDTARLHVEAVDAVLLEHLNTHTIPQFVATLAKQREAMYEAGENSGYADWDNALDGLLPDDVEPLPTQVAEYVRKLQQGKPGNAQAVRDLHERYDLDGGGTYCNLCSNHGDITWPCATIRALDSTEQ